jgi:hypothetical protein
MPVSFKTMKRITIQVKTPEENLRFCTTCGGLQAMSNTALDLDCPTCAGTGYENMWTTVAADASYRAGAIQRWNYVTGGLDTLGECSIKLSYKYKDILERATHLVMDGVKWKFSMLRDPGEAMGQHRINLALSRM